MKNLSKSVQYNLEQDLSTQQQSFARKNILARKIWTNASDVLDIEWSETTEITIPDNQIYVNLGTIPNTVRVIYIKLSTSNGFAADFAVRFFVQSNPTLKVVHCFVDDKLTNNKNMPTGNSAYKAHNYYLIRVQDTYAEYQNYFSSEGIDTIVPDIDGKHQEHVDTAITFTAKVSKNAQLLSDINTDTLNMEIGYNGQSRVGTGFEVEVIDTPIKYSGIGRVGSGHSQESYNMDIQFSSSGFELPHTEVTGEASMELLEFTITEPEDGSGS